MPGYGARYWADRTASARRRTYSKFRGSDTSDVVVIGGGLTGCASAYALSAAGLRVVLLEADRLAEGGTAGGTGVIVPQPDASYVSVENAAGRRVARIAWKEAERHAREFSTVLRKLPLRSDAAPASVYLNARLADEAASLRREQAMRKSAGLDAPWLSAQAARRMIGTDTAGAIRLRDGATFDPVRAALALAAAAVSKGARIFEKSPVRRTKFTRKDAIVALVNGTIRTRGVVVATAEPGTLFGQLRRHVESLEGHAVVTEPLAAAMRREAGGRDAILTELAASSWLRWLPEDRILFAGATAKPVPVRQRDKAIVQRTAQLMYELSLRYPIISGLPARWGWREPVVSTPDGLPWIGPHRNYPHHFFAIAMGWHGDALAWLAARAAVRHFRGESRREDEIWSFARYL